MPIYRCNACGYVSEDAVTPVGQKVACGRCGRPSTVYATVFFVEKLVERYAAALREIQALRAEDDDAPDTPNAAASNGVSELADGGTLDSRDFATAEQHAPLKAWFASRKIDAVLDYAQIDTTGYFDDAARLLGDRLDLFGELIDRVAYAYRKGHGWLNLELARLPQKDAQAINQLCRQLYSHTLFGRYHYQKAEKIVRLTLQTAPAVRRFFEGGWLEWYAFLEALEACKAVRRTQVACARGVKVAFPNEDQHELDVVVLPAGGAPVCIECKSGEFQRDLDKYLRLRKRLGLERQRFIIFSPHISNEQASGLSAMYDLSFMNLRLLRSHLQTLL
jgi:hypothetical protein